MDKESIKDQVAEAIEKLVECWEFNDTFGDRYFNRKDASQFLKVSEPTFDKLRSAGHIPVVYIGDIKRYRKSDLLKIGKEDKK